MKTAREWVSKYFPTEVFVGIAKLSEKDLIELVEAVQDDALKTEMMTTSRRSSSGRCPWCGEACLICGDEIQ